MTSRQESTTVAVDAARIRRGRLSLSLHSAIGAMPIAVAWASRLSGSRLSARDDLMDAPMVDVLMVCALSKDRAAQEHEMEDGLIVPIVVRYASTR